MRGKTIVKRIGAYLIDILVVSFIVAALTQLKFINPKYDQYEKYSNEYMELTDKFYEKEIDIQEFSSKVGDLSYNLNKSGYVYIICDIAIAFLYFGVFQYITHGQTLGKKLLGIKVVSAKDKKLKLYNYFIRAFILNGVISNLFIFIGIWFSKGTYNMLANIGSDVDSILSITIVLMILFYKDGRGLHDLAAQTKVIDLKDYDEQGIDEVKEAKYEEVKEEPKEITTKEEAPSKVKNQAKKSKTKSKKETKEEK